MSVHVLLVCQVRHLLRKLQTVPDNDDATSVHSNGNGSNTDSGRGASDDGDIAVTSSGVLKNNRPEISFLGEVTARTASRRLYKSCVCLFYRISAFNLRYIAKQHLLLALNTRRQRQIIDELDTQAPNEISNDIRNSFVMPIYVLWH
jgi:hypothetical protein